MPNYSNPLLIIRDKPSAFIDKFWEEQLKNEEDILNNKILKNKDEIDEELSNK